MFIRNNVKSKRKLSKILPNYLVLSLVYFGIYDSLFAFV